MPNSPCILASHLANIAVTPSVEAVGKPFREFDGCHADNSTSQNALYGSISSRGMVKGPPQSSPIDPSEPHCPTRTEHYATSSGRK